MRRAVVLVVALVAVALLPGDAVAKFGMSKTKIVLPRMRPPTQPLIAETVLVEVKSASPEVTGAHVSTLRGRVEDALRAAGLVEVVERPRDADAILRVSLSGLTAEVRDEIRMETKYVKIGERQEWNDKKKKMETKDVYGNRDTPVSMRIADGSLSASVEIEGRGTTRSADAGASYHDSFKVEDVPPEAATEESLRRFLVTQTAEHVVGTVSFSPDPVEALLAVNDELKNGNRLAESGLFQEALDEWNRRIFKGGTEAARVHNVGVAYEALAYKLPPFTPEHRDYLEKAKQNYLLAMKLDPGEKYFRDPPPRVDMSLSYAGTALMIAEEMEVYREERSAHAREARPAKGAAPAAKVVPASAPAPASAGPTAAGPAPPAQPLKNGSFEPSLQPWRLTGSGAVVSEANRGKVLDLPASASAVSVEQAVDVAIPSGRVATLAFEYKVTSGEARLRVAVVYADANGKERTSTLEVTAGEGPGGWTPWSEDVSGLRPRPTRITAIRILAEGGGVRLDNVALNVP